RGARGAPGGRGGARDGRGGRRRGMIAALRAEARQLATSLALYARLGGYVRAEARLLAVTVATMLAFTVVTLARPWPLQVIVDSVLGARPAPAWITAPLGELPPARLLAVAVALMVTALLLGQGLSLAQQYASQLLGQRMVLRLRCDLYGKLQRLSLAFHDRASVGDLIHRITGDAAALQHIVTYGFIPLAIQLVTAAALTGTIFLLDARLGAVALAVVPVLLAWTAWFSERVRRRTHGLAAAESAVYSTASEALGAIRAVKSFAMEDVEVRRFADHARSTQHAYVQVVTLAALGSLVTEVIVGLATAAIVFLGARAALQGGVTVGELLVFIAYLQALYGPVAQLAGAAAIIQRSAASVERVLQILDETDEHADSGRLRPARAVGRIAYQGVHAAYDRARPVLQDVTLEIEPGERVAFVGRSGAGKTTLVSLLLRFYRPARGRILLDGVDLGALDLTWLRRRIALVLQEPIIFSGTIRENIAYGRPSASDAEIVAAARAAGLDEFVAELPEGYATLVGERGVRLSGGQRQRLAIARAFLKDAPVLILDEPTSNLDAATEAQVFAALDRLARGRTTLVISHRLATVRRADRIVVMAGGRIVEQGTHEALLARGGVYAALHAAQHPGRPVAGHAHLAAWREG
ncbi:MAG TPA: ABC transporter ATP-binding protein, partial [Candidatus Tectomicrobia bacterium]|nr:ABC transporter ATP-binding protein [Candidatus Tectomicrobia bacterium]